MQWILNFGRKNLFLLIMISATLTFLAGIAVVIQFQSNSLISNQIKGIILDAQKLAQLDKNISFERALKIYGGDLPFSLFNQDCLPIYVSDLMILSSSCLNRIDSLEWRETKGIDNQAFIIGFSKQSGFYKYFVEHSVIIFWMVLIYIIFTLTLTLMFFRLFIDTPIRKLSYAMEVLLKQKSFDLNTFRVHKKTLFYPLYDKFTQLIDEIIRFNKEEEKYQLSRQIAHDLRAPLSVLETKISEAGTDKIIEKMALKRLKQISDTLMPESPDGNSTKFSINDIFQELRITYYALNFNQLGEQTIPTIKLPISELELFRFISNILKNALEANATQIEYEISISGTWLKIYIKDNGHGIEEELIPQIIQGKTTKTDGHGIGLSSLAVKMQSLGGDVQILSSPRTGFSIILNIPLIDTSVISYVLIDDDKFIRANWVNQAKRQGIKLACYDSIDGFIQEASQFSNETHIYTDSDLRQDLKGEVASEQIAKLGFKEIYLATGYSPTDFNLKLYPWIKAVKSKKPPF
jgi:signal transduction histidine kinase